jgi:hypothetical protein
MKTSVKSPESAVYRRGLGIFLTETPPTDTQKHLFRPLFPATPISPPSGPTQWLFQGPPAQSKFLAARGGFMRSAKPVSFWPKGIGCGRPGWFEPGPTPCFPTVSRAAAGMDAKLASIRSPIGSTSSPVRNWILDAASRDSFNQSNGTPSAWRSLHLGSVRKGTCPPLPLNHGTACAST